MRTNFNALVQFIQTVAPCWGHACIIKVWFLLPFVIPTVVRQLNTVNYVSLNVTYLRWEMFYCVKLTRFQRLIPDKKYKEKDSTSFKVMIWCDFIAQRLIIGCKEVNFYVFSTSVTEIPLWPPYVLFLWHVPYSKEIIAVYNSQNAHRGSNAKNQLPTALAEVHSKLTTALTLNDIVMFRIQEWVLPAPSEQKGAAVCNWKS